MVSGGVALANRLVVIQAATVKVGNEVFQAVHKVYVFLLGSLVRAVFGVVPLWQLTVQQHRPADVKFERPIAKTLVEADGAGRRILAAKEELRACKSALGNPRLGELIGVVLECGVWIAPSCAGANRTCRSGSSRKRGHPPSV